MKILHLADLHIGKKLDDYSLIEDQKHLFDEILSLIDQEHIEGLFISGDVFDLKSPSQEAYDLFNDFLTALHRKKVEVFMIPGNHDSDERVGYGRGVFSEGGIHIVNNAKDALAPIVWKGVNFYLLPFVNRFDIAHALGQDFDDLESAFRALVEAMRVDRSKTNIILSHQAFNADGRDPIRSLSENAEVGAIEYLPISLLGAFDYCALGHIHKKQDIGPNARYPGSPLKYHSGEANQQKSLTLLKVEGKKVEVSELPIHPLRDVRVIRDSYENVMRAPIGNPDDYIKFELTNPLQITNVMAKLKGLYPHALSVEYPNIASSGPGVNGAEALNVEEIPLKDLFARFYAQQTGKPMSDSQQQVIASLLKEED